MNNKNSKARGRRLQCRNRNETHAPKNLTVL
jgi:hypothetical protein